MKQGEKQAMKILEHKRIVFDTSYRDNNQTNSMPDLKYLNGGYLEVTHTKHNHSVYLKQNQYFQKIEEQDTNTQEFERASQRLWEDDYEKEDGELTEDSKKQYLKDFDICKQFLGWNSKEKQFGSEFQSTLPVAEMSPDNILQEIVDDKGSKYKDRNIDLFIFVTQEEYNSMMWLISTAEQNNGTAISFLRCIYNSPFPLIYICVWDLMSQKYNLKNPTLLKFWKCDNEIRWEELM